jgi:3-oxoadipate enol-lactonase
MPQILIQNFVCNYQFDDLGKNETLIFSNSLGTNLSMWDEQAEFLSQYFNILRYDTRGHGASGVPESRTGFSIEELGKDVLALLEILSLGSVHFCGLSLGGLIGQWLGINAPERFKTIILSNTAAKIGNLEGWNARISQVSKDGLESITHATKGRWFTSTFIQENPSIIEVVLSNFINTTISGYIANCTAVRDADFRNELHLLKVPTLIISGTEDVVTTVEDGIFLAKKIPNSSRINLSAAHLSNIEKSEEFSKAILKHIKFHNFK